MSRSLDASSLARSNSYSAGDHSSLSRTQNIIQRSGSVRRKILPSFEPLSESTESESDDSKKNSPLEDDGREERRLTTPAPVDIAGGDEYEESEISSSSEIEVGENSRSSEMEQFLDGLQEDTFAPTLHRECR